MFGNTATPSLADIAAVTKDQNGDNFGNNGWWILIILFALFGWGRGGYDNGGGSNMPNVVYIPPNNGNTTANFDAALQRGFDNQTVVNKLNGLENGICGLGYDQLNQMNGINSNIMQTGFGIQNAITNMGIANMQDTNALSRQLSDCCCENRQGQADIKYTMATDTCAITTAIEKAARDIMQNDNANYRQLHDENVAIQMAAKDAKIQEQAALIASLNLAQSQANQTLQLVDTLRPQPVPSYNVPNPWASQQQYGCCSGSNSGCCNYG